MKAAARRKCVCRPPVAAVRQKAARSGLIMGGRHGGLPVWVWGSVCERRFVRMELARGRKRRNRSSAVGYYWWIAVIEGGMSRQPKGARRQRAAKQGLDGAASVLVHPKAPAPHLEGRVGISAFIQSQMAVTAAAGAKSRAFFSSFASLLYTPSSPIDRHSSIRIGPTDLKSPFSRSRPPRLGADDSHQPKIQRVQRRVRHPVLLLQQLDDGLCSGSGMGTVRDQLLMDTVREREQLL